MNMLKVNKTYKRQGAAICGKQIPCAREHGKLCPGQPEMLRASQDNLLRLLAGGGLLQSRKPLMKSNNKPPSVQ